MKTTQVKKIIYRFIKEELVKAFPANFHLDNNGATHKIFWSKSKGQKPYGPYVELDDVFKSKLHQRYETYQENNKNYTREQWRLTVSFRVCTLASEGCLIDAETLADEIIEFLESLLTSNQIAFDRFDEFGIVVNERESTPVIDLTNFNFTNNEYKKQFSVPFEYEDIKEYEVTAGKAVQTTINISGTQVPITTEEKAT